MDDISSSNNDKLKALLLGLITVPLAYKGKKLGLEIIGNTSWGRKRLDPFYKTLQRWVKTPTKDYDLDLIKNVYNTITSAVAAPIAGYSVYNKLAPDNNIPKTTEEVILKHLLK